MKHYSVIRLVRYILLSTGTLGPFNGTLGPFATGFRNLGTITKMNKTSCSECLSTL